MTLKDIIIIKGNKAITYICDKSCSSYVHQSTGMEAYKTLQRYYKIPAVADKTEAYFSVSGILYANPKYNGTRKYAYGYDMNSAFSWGMLQNMPKDTEKGPIAFSRKVKDNEIGFLADGTLALKGEYAAYLFNSEESPFKRFVEVWYNKKKNAKTPEDKVKAKDILVMSVGYIQRKNFWYRAAIIGYCNRLIHSLIKKYPEDILVSNTDSIISTCRIPEIEANLGQEIGQWKFEHEGNFAYIGLNYQWDFCVPTYRGIPKSWFKQFKDKYDILRDGLPPMANYYEYNKKKQCLERVRYGK